MNTSKLKFPIGNFYYQEDADEKQKQLWIQTIEQFPKKIQEISSSLTTEQLQWQYRPEGWKIKQVIHHCADSHLHSFIRFKLALTEDNPTIRPYEEHLWANLSDSLSDDIHASIAILTGVHFRWCQLLHTMQDVDFSRKYFHPANQKHYTLKEALALYAWHCEHHFAHIENAIINKGKYNV